jgi:tRNA threonylcarbamoyladenosine biosynthesis protein TsaE
VSHSTLCFDLPDPLVTEALGEALALAYAADPGQSAVIFLHGELGAGKTTCVRSLLRALGVVGLIRSPTYTLVETYRPEGNLTFVHVDLYRLGGPDAVEELGLRDFLGGDCLLLVEWPEKGGKALPSPDLEVTLTYRGNSRRALLTASTSRGLAWCDKLVHDTRLTTYVSNLT